MKLVIALFALSIGTVAIAGAPSAAASSAAEASGSSMGCPPPVYECCDGAIGSGAFCANHGGKCFVISICGEPV